VEWQDSHGGHGWQEIGARAEDRALVCRSVGWLALDGEEAKVLVPHLSEQDPGAPLQGSGIMTIPTRAVLRVTPLTEATHSA
jgi:hypothetical protein